MYKLKLVRVAGRCWVRAWHKKGRPWGISTTARKKDADFDKISFITTPKACFCFKRYVCSYKDPYLSRRDYWHGAMLREEMQAMDKLSIRCRENWKAKR